MAVPWHPSSPIETLYLQIDDDIAFSLAGKSPIDNNTAVRNIYNIIASNFHAATGKPDHAAKNIGPLYNLFPRRQQQLLHYHHFRRLSFRPSSSHHCKQYPYQPFSSTQQTPKNRQTTHQTQSIQQEQTSYHTNPHHSTKQQYQNYILQQRKVRTAFWN